MRSKEEIEEAKEEIKETINLFYEFPNPQSVLLQDNKVQYLETLLQYQEQLEQENKHYKEFIVATGGKDIENITATKYMEIKQEGYIQGRIEEQDKLLKCINKQNKMIDEMADMISIFDYKINLVAFGGQARFGSNEEVKQYFEKKVDENLC